MKKFSEKLIEKGGRVATINQNDINKRKNGLKIEPVIIDGM